MWDRLPGQTFGHQARSKSSCITSASSPARLTSLSKPPSALAPCRAAHAVSPRLAPNVLTHMDTGSAPARALQSSVETPSEAKQDRTRSKSTNQFLPLMSSCSSSTQCLPRLCYSGCSPTRRFIPTADSSCNSTELLSADTGTNPTSPTAGGAKNRFIKLCEAPGKPLYE